MIGFISTLAVASLFKYNGPYVKGTYTKGSIFNSFWEMRPLNASRVSEDSDGDDEEDEMADAKTKGIFDDALVTKGGEATQTIQCSNVPLNQQLCAAVNLEDKQLYEGGETEVIDTERGLATDRAFNTEMVPQADQENKQEDPAEILMKRMTIEAEKRLSIENDVQVPKRYATLFNGLKLNTAHNSAVMEPLVFLVRRFLYAMVIVLLSHKPQVALMLMIGLSVVVLAFTVVEKPWKNSDMQTLAVANESFFLLILVLVIGCTATAPAHGLSKDILGWAIIVAVTLVIHVNVIVMLAKSY